MSNMVILLIFITFVACCFMFAACSAIRNAVVEWIDGKEDASISATAIEIYRAARSAEAELTAERSYRVSRILHGYPPE